VGVRTSQICVGFYFLSRSRGNREISLVALGMNEIGVRRSNSYGLVDLTYCSEYTKKFFEATRLFSIRTYREAAALSLQL